MADVNIKYPIKLNMDLLEVDEYLPSMKMGITCEIMYYTASFLYKSEGIWFSCSSWDDFVRGLLKLENYAVSEAYLLDMSEYFCLRINQEENNSFNFSVDAQQLGLSIERKKMKLSFSTIMDLEELQILRRGFHDFPKWW